MVRTLLKIARLMQSIMINGKTYMTSGKDVKINNTGVYVDGILVENYNSYDVKVVVNGDVHKLDATSVTINGNVTGSVDCTSLKCGDIEGDVDATSVHAGFIGGKVNATTVKYKS